MNIATLEFIHEQLQAAHATAENAKIMVRNLYYQAEEENAPNLRCLEERYENLRKAAETAYNALCDFEGQDW